MKVIKTYCGNCVKMFYKGYEISIAIEENGFTDVRVYTGENFKDNVTKEFKVKEVYTDPETLVPLTVRAIMNKIDKRK